MPDVNPADDLAAYPPPIIAILRGIRPAEVAPAARALFAAGIRLAEVPLNAPDALSALAELAAAAPGDALVGAGTVLDVRAVDAAAQAGARFVVAPNANPAVIARALALGLAPVPGVLTPTEAFAALAAGARDLKLFPAASAGPPHLAALREVLPPDCRVWAVGGVTAWNLADWLAAGAFGAAAGGAVYRPGRAPDEIHERAAALVAGWHAAGGART